MATHLFHGLKKEFSILAVFRVPNFWGRFEALNDVFWGFRAQTNVFKHFILKNKIVLLGYTFPTMYRAPQMKIICKSYAPKKLTYQLPPSGPANLLDFLLLLLMLKRTLEPHCNNHLLANASSCHISSQR